LSATRAIIGESLAVVHVRQRWCAEAFPVPYPKRLDKQQGMSCAPGKTGGLTSREGSQTSYGSWYGYDNETLKTCDTKKSVARETALESRMEQGNDMIQINNRASLQRCV